MIRYLTEQDIILINVNVIKTYSPKEQIGVKEPESLNMTVEAPKQFVFDRELYPTRELKAACLYRNLVMKHIFFNGNKRTAANTVYVFLRLNGSVISVDPDEFTDFTVRIAVEKLNEEAIAEWLKFHLK